ncbi:NmrA/HSCARG family protein [Brenneria populi subsp. brevivirga]|uniref:NmrA/HSCARG family protein n=1 Tax=Brenneria populi TaxID=1505588 RepID=UPI002E191D02|nr:NmrA/HSCARG family protein [Brenneria populi subsp. brevivirga]
MNKRTIVVLGATGHQGGAVARSLIADGYWKVRALSRNPDSDTARRLTAGGIDVVAADMDSPESLPKAFAGAYGVFSVQGSEGGGEMETRRGIAVADAALAAGVEHLVYSSVGGANRRSRVPHFDSKWRVEEHISKIGIPATIARPVFFMENFVGSGMRTVLFALMRSYIPAEKPLQMIATDDIGKWVAYAFAHPETFIGKSEEIAGDELTRKQIAAAFKRHGLSTGLPFPIPRLLLRPLPYDIRRMFEWFGEAGYAADIPALKTRLPGLLTLDSWLAELDGTQSTS